MRRAATNDDSDWETTGNSSWKTPKVASTKPRRVTLDEPWESNIYSVPRPTHRSPEEMDPRSERAEKTPNPLQSPPFQVQNDEVQLLKERMDRQEDLMEKMTNEITSLRRELKEKESNKVEWGSTRKTECGGGRGVGEGVPFATTQANREQTWRDPVSVRSSEAADMGPRRTSFGSPGAKFVAEFSELIELDRGQHELLASIMDQSLSRNQRNRSRHENL